MSAAASTPERDRLLRAAALRVYRRYQLEVVEALHLCPWAERARVEGHVREQVLLLREADVDSAAAAVASLAEEAPVEIGLLLLPRLHLDRTAFERFVARVRDEHTRHDEAEQRARALPGGARMALAAFHPDASLDLANAERLVPFLRRTPDPTIQLVRRTVLERIRSSDGAHGTGMVDLATLDLAALLAEPARIPLHERVAVHNLATVTARGSEIVSAILADIRRDRDETYAALGESPPPWAAPG